MGRIIAVTFGYGFGFFAIWFLLSWVIGPKLVGILMMIFVLLGLLYQLNYGELSRALPRIKSIDYFVTGVGSVVTYICFFTPIIPNDGYRIVIFIAWWFIWGLYYLFRYPSMSAGATVSLSEVVGSTNKEKE